MVCVPQTKAEGLYDSAEKKPRKKIPGPHTNYNYKHNIVEIQHSAVFY